MSDLLQEVRYWVAVLVIISLPGAVVYWYAVHPFVGFWRRLGVKLSLTILFTLFGLSIVGLYFVRDQLMGADLGPPYPLAVAVGALLLLAAMVVQILVSRQLSRSILVGAPELSTEDRGQLLTSGPYAYTRNPRYLVILVAMLGYSLLLSYVGVWLITLLIYPALYLIILLEERELRERFGSEYEAYCERVPRLLPRRPGGQLRERTKDETTPV